MIVWPVETISDDSLLYCYVHKSQIDKESLKPIARAFRNTPFEGGTDLSTDWNQYTTPEESLERLNLQKKGNGTFKNSKDYGLVSFKVEVIRNELKSQSIVHDPIQHHDSLPENRSHTKIIGEKDTEVRLKMIDMCDVLYLPKNDDT